MSRPLIAASTALFLATLVTQGCSSGGPKPLNPATFIQPTADTRIDQNRSSNDDRPGQLLIGARVDQSDAPGPVAPTSIPPKDRPIDQQLPTPDVTSISPAVSDSVKTPADAATQRATTELSSESAHAPAAPITALSPGEYMTLGAVVVEVNGNPIYANKILGDISPLLAAHARESTEDQFHALARDEVAKQTDVLIRTELEFAAAQRNLDSKDQKLANDLTMQWRDQQITQAGGALEAARAHALADGQNFDDQVKEQYRVEMRRIYFQKKEFPKLQITAQDMRDYYSKHLDDVFTQHEQAKFRIIKVSFEESGGKQQALDKINSLRAQLVKGVDFNKVSGTPPEDEDWIPRGAFANQQIEDAVWKLKPGGVTPPIELPQQYAIALLDAKQEGTTRSFADPEVQAGIRRSLEAQQFNELRAKAQKNLLDEAIISPYPPHIDPAVDMAMQMYPIWAKTKK